MVITPDKVFFSAGVQGGVSASLGANFSYSITPDGHTVITLGTGSIGVGGNYSITW